MLAYGDELKDQLVEKVKQLQRSSQELKERWWALCKKHGSVDYDPKLKDVRFLTNFINICERSSPSKGSEPAVDGSAAEGSDGTLKDEWNAWGDSVADSGGSSWSGAGNKGCGWQYDEWYGGKKGAWSKPSTAMAWPGNCKGWSADAASFAGKGWGNDWPEAWWPDPCWPPHGDWGSGSDESWGWAAAAPSHVPAMEMWKGNALLAKNALGKGSSGLTMGMGKAAARGPVNMPFKKHEVDVPSKTVLLAGQTANWFSAMGDGKGKSEFGILDKPPQELLNRKRAAMTSAPVVMDEEQAKLFQQSLKKGRTG